MSVDYLKIYDELKRDGTILSDLIGNVDDIEINSAKIIEILNSSYGLEYYEDEDMLYYIDKNGDKYECPDLSVGMTESSEWLSNKLPAPFIDFDQGGSVRRIEEARAIYTIICIGLVIDNFKEEIIDQFNQYNFKELAYKTDDSDYNSMTAYLNSFLELNSLRINSVASSASIRISSAIEKKDVFWKSLLSLEEITEFAKVSRDVKNIILTYERDRSLNPSEISKLSRVQKLQTLDERNIAIDKVIDASPCAVLYRISKFNSERLSPVIKRKIMLTAKKIARQYVLQDKLVKREADEVYEREFNIHFRDLSRMAVTTLRSNEIIKYKNDPLNYKFMKKR